MMLALVLLTLPALTSAALGDGAGVNQEALLVATTTPPPRIDLKACEQQGRQSICVAAHFDGLISKYNTADLTCQAYERKIRPDTTPECFRDLTDSSAIGHASCNTSLPCEVFLQKVVKPDTTYFVFCCGFAFAEGIEDSVFLPTTPTCTKKRHDCGLEVVSEPVAGPDLQQKFGVEDLAGVVLLMVYICWGILFKYVRVIHETGMAVLGGMIMGSILRQLFHTQVVFSYSFFSYFVLPMVIFNAGFNLQKKQFFKYSAYILGLGVIGTVIIFIVLYFSAELFMRVCIPKSSYGTQLRMNSHHRLIMAAVLASTDSVAPMAFLPADVFPKLYAVVFGEGVLNDVVSVLLCTAADTSSEMPKVGELMRKILYFMFTSCAMGLLFGLALSYTLKRARDVGSDLLQGGDLKPLVLLLCVNYTCYIATELCEFSSIFALFVSALVSGHYAVHALKPSGREFAREFAEVLAFCAEAFVFGYFGLTSVRFVTDTKKQSAALVCFYVVAIFVARAIAVSVVMLILKVATCWHSLKLSLAELSVVGLAGSLRGTIAFALILHAAGPEDMQTDTQTVMVSTVLFIVLIDTLVFGALFPVLLKVVGLSQGPRESTDALADLLEPCGADSSLAGLPVRTVHPIGRAAHLRNPLHGLWHYLDTKYMKPTFRPECSPEENGSHAEQEVLHDQNVGSPQLAPPRTVVQESGAQTSFSPRRRDRSQSSPKSAHPGASMDTELHDLAQSSAPIAPDATEEDADAVSSHVELGGTTPKDVESS